jgi:hypothetical protein
MITNFSTPFFKESSILFESKDIDGIDISPKPFFNPLRMPSVNTFLLL